MYVSALRILKNQPCTSTVFRHTRTRTLPETPSNTATSTRTMRNLGAKLEPLPVQGTSTVRKVSPRESFTLSYWQEWYFYGVGRIDAVQLSFGLGLIVHIISFYGR